MIATPQTHPGAQVGTPAPDFARRNDTNLNYLIGNKCTSSLT